MPKLKARITITSTESSDASIGATFIVESASPLSAMATFSAAANQMPYTGPVTNDQPASAD